MDGDDGLVYLSNSLVKDGIKSGVELYSCCGYFFEFVKTAAEDINFGCKVYIQGFSKHGADSCTTCKKYYIDL